MLTAIIILALLSLLVATEADPASAPVDPTPGEPLRPACKFCGTQGGKKSDRLAA